jgi:hypothetical protein
MPIRRITIPLSKEQDQPTKATFKRLEDDLDIMVEDIYTDIPEMSLVSGGTITLSDDVVITHETGAAKVSAGDFRVTNSGTDTTSVITVAGTQTLTNKTLTSPTINTPTIATPTITSPAITDPTVTGALPVTGAVRVHSGTAIPAGGTAGAGLLLSSATNNFGVFFGSGAPSLAAATGSFYLRSNGSGTNNRLYVNTGGTGWTAVVTVG